MTSEWPPPDVVDDATAVDATAHRARAIAQLESHPDVAPIEQIIQDELRGTVASLGRNGSAATAAARPRATGEYGPALAHEDLEAEPPPNPAARLPRFQFVTDEELERRKPREQIVDPILLAATICLVYAPPESFKSFFILALALSVASGRPFAGFSVRGGPVVYVAAEGGDGLGPRIRAWKATAGVETLADVRFVTEPVNLMEDRDVTDFVAQLLQLPAKPVLVIFDTLSWCMLGGDENRTPDMMRAINGMKRVRDATGAATIAVHHTRADGEKERGSSSNRGGMDIMFELKRDGRLVTVHCQKDKDRPHFPDFRMRLQEVPATGSCTLVDVDRCAAPTTDGMSERERSLLAVLHQSFADDSATATQWMEASGLAKRTFYEVKGALWARGYLDRDKKGRGARFSVSDVGRIALGARCGEGAGSVRRTDSALVGAGALFIEPRTTAPSTNPSAHSPSDGVIRLPDGGQELTPERIAELQLARQSQSAAGKPLLQNVTISTDAESASTATVRRGEAGFGGGPGA